MSDDNVSKFEVFKNKTDKEVADDIKFRLVEALVPVLSVMNEGRRMSLRITFTLGPDWKGEDIVTSLEIMKIL